MSEERWCQACWLTKRTVFHDEFDKWLCEQCFDAILTQAINTLVETGVIEKQ